MKIVAAYLLAALSGKTPDEKAVTNILSSVGIEADQDQVKQLIQQLAGKNLNEVIEAGRAKLSAVAVAPAPAAGAAAPAASAAAAAKEEKADKKEEKGAKEKKPKEEEKKEEEEEDFGFGLFD
jgi:large subunit ribosomal protein LP2